MKTAHPASILGTSDFLYSYHIKQDLNHGFNIAILNSKIKIIALWELRYRSMTRIYCKKLSNEILARRFKIDYNCLTKEVKYYFEP